MFGLISCHFSLRREYFPESFIKKKYLKNLEFLSSILRHSVFAFFFFIYIFCFSSCAPIYMYINYDIALPRILSARAGSSAS